MKKYVSHIPLAPLVVLLVVCSLWFFFGLDQIFYNVLYFMINDVSEAEKNLFEKLFIPGIIIIAIVQTIVETRRNLKSN